MSFIYYHVYFQSDIYGNTHIVTEQDPMKPSQNKPLPVLSLPFVCRKTLVKE